MDAYVSLITAQFYKNSSVFLFNLCFRLSRIVCFHALIHKQFNHLVQSKRPTIKPNIIYFDADFMIRLIPLSGRRGITTFNWT